MALLINHQLEPIPLPNIRRPEQIPSYPAWVRSRAAACRNVNQKGPEGEYRIAPTLPPNLTLAEAQRDAIKRHIGSLKRLLVDTPASSADIENDVLVALTKMMLTLPSMRQSEIGAEARGEAYLAALDDLPKWAIEAAIRCWYRGDAGTDSAGRPFDCHWLPAPADLRYVAARLVGRIKLTAASLQRLLDAEPLIEYSDEDRGAMLKRLATIKVNGIALDLETAGEGELSPNLGDGRVRRQLEFAV
jgi:hypothetical protein